MSGQRARECCQCRLWAEGSRGQSGSSSSSSLDVCRLAVLDFACYHKLAHSRDYLISRWSVCFCRNRLYFISSMRPVVFRRFCADQARSRSGTHRCPEHDLSVLNALQTERPGQVSRSPHLLCGIPRRSLAHLSGLSALQRNDAADPCRYAERQRG